MSLQTTPHPLDDPSADPFEIARIAAAELADRTGVERHDIALTLGSGWAKAADLIGETTATIPASEITGFSKPALEGHSAPSCSRAASEPSSSARGPTTTRGTGCGGSCTRCGPRRRPGHPP